MGSKYYTPTIEEFYIGFEYEQYIISHRREGKASTWVQMKIQELEDLLECENSLSLEGNIDAKYVRVKILDREDIESLGFTTLHEESFLFKSRFHLTINVNYIHISDNFHNGTRVVFDGIIKNKSELKRLMVQLGIK